MLQALTLDSLCIKTDPKFMKVLSRSFEWGGLTRNTEMKLVYLEIETYQCA